MKNSIETRYNIFSSKFSEILSTMIQQIIFGIIILVVVVMQLIFQSAIVHSSKECFWRELIYKMTPLSGISIHSSPADIFRLFTPCHILA